MYLIHILIVIFILLIGYQIFLASSKNPLIEGLENTYQDYGNDPMILAKQNAGNIEVLKGRIDKLDGLGIEEKLQNMQLNINSMQDNLDKMGQQIADFGDQLAGSTPPEIT